MKFRKLSRSSIASGGHQLDVADDLTILFLEVSEPQW